MSLKKILFIPDTHIPYHDKKAWKLMVKCAEKFHPEYIVIEGDFIDNYTVSSHNKNPNRALKLDEEVNETKKHLDELSQLGARHKIFIAGNHEYRLERYLMEKAPELYNIISTPSILDLKAKGWEYVAYKDHYAIGKLNITHDVGTAGRYAHYKALDTFQHNVIIGHTHRLGYAVEGNSQGERHLTAMFGWLGDISQVDYMHKIAATRNWSLGFGIGYYDTKTGCVYVVPIPIINYTCVIEGNLFKI